MLSEHHERMGERRMAGPLDGLLVVDMSWGMPGSIAGMLFADYGARVVKVERPGGGREPASIRRRVFDRGKWSIELDPTTESARDHLLALLERADVLIEAFGPGGAEKLGFGYSTVRDRCP